MRFLPTLLARGPSTPLSRYTEWNGALYLGMGLLLYAWPQAAQTLFFAPAFVGSEAGLVRMLGVVLAVVGWFYVMGARTGADSFGLATVVDRLLVPAFLVPLAVTGAVAPQLALPFAVLDPLLAVGAFLIWRRTSPAPR
ncbi:MAG: hypothetical protein JNJ54_15220 [Myxococcaceae bacterium]|nr:hypothetical protein [Myxococcaceae bacterium]